MKAVVAVLKTKDGVQNFYCVLTRTLSSYYFKPMKILSIICLSLSFLLLGCASVPNDYSDDYKDRGLTRDLEREYLGPDLWELIENNYTFAPKYYNNRLVRRHVDALKSNPEYLDAINERAELFLHYIRKELEKRNMPTELALLPAVESGYDPYAYSPAGASGLWQFIEPTGDKFGLDNIWWYSDRRDFEASTKAALDYLEYLYKKYGDWQLSLAAYNTGEKRVNKAIRYNRARGKSTDYWALHSLPRETENYVPRLIAFNYIFSKEQRHELGLRTIPAQATWVKVPVDNQVPMAEIISLARLDEEKFYLLNAGHNQWVTSPYKEHLYVLFEEYPRLKRALDNFVVDAPLWVSYRILAHDTLSSIAQKFNLAENKIREFNQVDRLAVGNYVVLPISSAAITPLPESEDPPRYLVGLGPIKDHKIKTGDNLHSIARTYRVSVANIQELNGIRDPHMIRAGQRIVVSKPQVKNPSILLSSDYDREVIRSVYYKVRRGDNLYRIAAKFNTSVEQIKRWNSHKAIGDRLYTGQYIKLYLDVTDL